MKHPLLLVLLWFIMTSPAQLAGQALEGFSLIDAGLPNQAIEAFRAELSSSKRMPAAAWGMALAWQALDQSDSAYAAVARATTAYREAGKGRKVKLQRLGLDPAGMNRMKRALEEDALATALKAGSLEAYDYFLVTFNDAPRRLKQPVVNGRHALALEYAAQADTYETCAQLFASTRTEASRLDPIAYQRAEDRLFDLFIIENGWSMLDSLSAAFPKLSYLRDPGLLEFLSIRDRGDAQLLESFSRQHPESLFARMAIDSAAAGVFRLLAGEGSLADYCAFVARWPNSTYVDQLDPWLASAFTDQPFLHVLEPSIRKVAPMRLPLTMEALYNQYRSTGRASDLQRFSNRYPGYPPNGARLKADLELAHRYGAISAMLSSGEATHSAVSEELDDIIRKAAPGYLAILALQTLIQPDVEAGAWDDALLVADSYRRKFKDGPAILDSLLALLKRPLADVALLALDSTVNTSYPEYSPVLSADDSRLYFCRDEGVLMSSDENVLISTLQPDGSWSKAQVLPPFDGAAHESPLAISSDGSTLLVFREGRMMTSQRTATGWSEPQPVGPAINESRWQGGATLSADGKALLFAAMRPDCLGPDERDVDLFVSLRQPDGSWGEAISLGPDINTVHEDRSPFLHPDQKTLYFSSRGHGGLGQLDVFKSERLDDGWSNWSTPVNLGREINTAGADWGYKVTTDGARACFSARGIGNSSDLFFVSLPQSLRPKPVSTIAGIVVDDATGKPLAASVLIEDLANGEIVATLSSDPLTGAFFITLPQGRLYSYTITREDYFDAADHLDLTRQTDPVNRLESTIRLRTIDAVIEEGASFVLNNLFFDTDNADLRPESYPQLDRLAGVLLERGSSVEIAGHTDNQGSKAYNVELSEQRALSVKKYLMDKGVESPLLSVRGYGESQPVSSNQTEAGRAQNRRVEITFK